MRCPSHIVPVLVGDPLKARLAMEHLFDRHRIYVQVHGVVAMVTKAVAMVTKVLWWYMLSSGTYHEVVHVFRFWFWFWFR